MVWRALLLLIAAAPTGPRSTLICIGGCPPPEAYADPIDRQIAETGVGVPGRPSPCAREETVNGHPVVAIQPTQLCYKMLPQQRFRGLWRHAMEDSQFCPEPAKECPDPATSAKIRLEGGPGRGGHGELYRVDFIGRRTAYKDGYGPSDYVIVMDEAINIELIEDPMSKAAQAALKSK